MYYFRILVILRTFFIFKIILEVGKNNELYKRFLNKIILYGKAINKYNREKINNDNPKNGESHSYRASFQEHLLQELLHRIQY